VGKPKPSLVLPIIQVVITVLVTVWADRSSWLLLGDSARVPGPYVHVDLFVLFFRVIWRGVNAPTWPLCMAGPSNHMVFGVSPTEILYFAAVAVLWYFVARFLERRNEPERRVGTSGTFLTVLILAWGITLLALGVFNTRDLSVRFVRIRPDGAIASGLLLTWAFLLIAFPARKLLLVLRNRDPGRSATE